MKCLRNVGSALYEKMRTPKLHVILKKMFSKGMTYTQTGAKSISLLNAYDPV